MEFIIILGIVWMLVVIIVGGWAVSRLMATCIQCPHCRSLIPRDAKVCYRCTRDV